MSWWEQSISNLVRITAGEYGITVPFDRSSIGVDATNTGFYSDFKIRLTRADDDGCCDDSCGCCQNICCNCCDDKPQKTEGFVAVYPALNYTPQGELYFRFDDNLFERGSGRYEGVLQRGSGKDCDEFEDLCAFVLLIEDGICLDWSRAKGVKLDTTKLGSCA